MNSNLFWRILIAVFFAVFVFLLMPPVFRVLGFPLTGDLEVILKLCVAGIAIFYILRGQPQ